MLPGFFTFDIFKGIDKKTMATHTHIYIHTNVKLATVVKGGDLKPLFSIAST